MREVRRRWRAASTRARCVSHASLASFSRKKTYARKTTMPRRPRTRGRIFDARARLCAAKIHAPNINQRCPTPWIQLTCLVGTVTVCRATKDDKKHPSRATLDARRFFFASARSLFFAYDPTPDGKDDIHVPRVPSRAPDRPRCDSCCRPRLSVSVRCVFLRAFIITSLPATVLGRRVIGRDPLCPSVALRTSLCRAHRSRSQRVAMTGRRRGCFYIRFAVTFLPASPPRAREARRGEAPSRPTRARAPRHSPRATTTAR